jgi:hypothetical protein
MRDPVLAPIVLVLLLVALATVVSRLVSRVLRSPLLLVPALAHEILLLCVKGCITGLLPRGPYHAHGLVAGKRRAEIVGARANGRTTALQREIPGFARLPRRTDTMRHVTLTGKD